METALTAARAILLEARSKRPRPHLDDKVLTAWNALMISAFAKGAQALDDPIYEQAARRAADFVLRHLYDPEHVSLQRRYREGESAIPGFLDDYAFLLVALLDLYETVFDTYYLELAVQLAGRMRELFEDSENGGFFSTPEGDANLILRMKDDYDGAEPSGNSIAVLALLRLARITGREEFEQPGWPHAEGIRLAACVHRQRSAAHADRAYVLERQSARQVVLAGPRDDAAPMLEAVRSRFLPYTTVLAADEESRPVLARYISAIGDMKPLDGCVAAYVCENFTCQLPVTEVAKLNELLQ